MSKLSDLKDKRGNIVAKMSEMTQQIDDWTPELTIEYDECSKKFDTLTTNIDRLERVESAENSLDSFDSIEKPAVGKKDNSTKYGSDDYENNFSDHIRSKGRISNALEEGTDSEGGYVVAQSWEAVLDRYLEDEVTMRRLATVVKYNSDRNIPLTTSNGTATWIAEEGSYGNNDIAFSNKLLQAYKLGNIIKVSEELLQDSIINLKSEIGLAYGESFGTVEEVGFTTGDGSGKPTGFMTDATSGKTAAGTAAVTYDEMIDLQHSVRDVYGRKGTWMMTTLTAAIIRKLKSSDGVPLWQPNLQAGKPNILLGREVVINEAMAEMTTGLKPIAFGDFSKYRIADRVGIVMQVLNELYAANGQVGFKIHKRTDGKLIRTEAIKYLTMA